jgi:hypothetical protein
MNRHRFSNLALSGAVAGVVLALLSCWASTSPADSNSSLDQGVRFERPSAETVRTTADQILSESRFSERWSLWQWLREKLLSGMDLDWSFNSTFWRVVGWIVVTWCGLTLVAILAHLIWTIWTLVGGSSWRRGASPRDAHFRKPGQLSCHQLVGKMRQLAEDGQYRQALAVMMLALLRRLEELGAVSFHESKTNGDYVREYSPAFAGRDDFSRFVTSFDSAIYGRATKDEEAYTSLHALFEQMGSNVEKRQEI